MEIPGEDAAVVVVDIPPEVYFASAGLYGIAYDLYTNSIEKAPPRGWQMHRSQLYRTIQKFLTQYGFYRAQYSVWQCSQPAVSCWSRMMSFRCLLPPGVFPTVIRRLEMFLIPWDFLIVTDDVTLGGRYYPYLIYRTPTGLVEHYGSINDRGVDNVGAQRGPWTEPRHPIQ
ncbi:hypothetical protein PNOK_0752600 [Pyrrhoderma noxium]|uniref:Uncharacterized protein n=1 Tax=Pyrrhoderma noxium TaxID=2282107 RepID=A0A286UCX3_9AGAM|nr:hypothetical protein PNOK_0752600 [Pyrrhoderma noxium]